MKEATIGIKKRIAMYIVYAQIASDAGKGKLNTELSRMLSGKMLVDTQRLGYAAKDVYIQKACQLISGYRNTGFKFRCTGGDITKSLFYFEFKVDEKKYQVSFHNLYSNEEWKEASQHCRIKWDHRDSRESCCVLAAAFGL